MSDTTSLNWRLLEYMYSMNKIEITWLKSLNRLGPQWYLDVGYR